MEFKKIKLGRLELNKGQYPGLPENPREWKKKDLEDLARSMAETPELAEARGAIGQLGGRIREIRDYSIPGTDVVHRVVIIDKLRSTPRQFPRAFAKIKKNPLI